MEQRIMHACGHEQAHYLTGYASQRDRRARWLTTTKCRTCFVAEKKAEQAEASSRDGTAIAHLDLPPLTAADRQVSWATAIRASRLAFLIAEADAADTDACQICLPITDAKWWIDHRDLRHVDLLAKAEGYVGPDSTAVDPMTQSSPSEAA